MSDIFTSVCQRKAETEHFWIMQTGDFDMHRKVMLEWGSEFMKWKEKNGLLNYMFFFPILLNLEGIQFCHKKLWLKLVPPTPAVVRRINRFEEGVGNGLQGGLCLLVSTSWPDPVPWNVGGTCMCFCPEEYSKCGHMLVDSLHVAVTSASPRDSYPHWLWRSKLPYCEDHLERPHGKELRAVSGQSPGRSQGPWFICHKKMNASCNHGTSKVDCFPAEPPNETQTWPIPWLRLPSDPASWALLMEIVREYIDIMLSH